MKYEDFIFVVCGRKLHRKGSISANGLIKIIILAKFSEKRWCEQDKREKYDCICQFHMPDDDNDLIDCILQFAVNNIF